MADFCNQCADFLNFPRSRWNGDESGICETCGIVLLNTEGACCDPRCPVHGDNPTVDAYGYDIKPGGTKP